MSLWFTNRNQICLMGSIFFTIILRTGQALPTSGSAAASDLQAQWAEYYRQMYYYQQQQQQGASGGPMPTQGGGPPPQQGGLPPS